ncbi:uncharacterized protein LOC134966775 [Pseudophryne corroboree]|uniref:uncharacterized protein LOC134966775 n=1 Tax=Pseudophryne corroboree TaxID=495146 RepID=UPI003081A985
MIQIVIDSLKTGNVCNLPFTMNKSERIQDVQERFEHMKAYMELRRYMLTMVQRQFRDFVEQGKPLKIWLSEALELQEGLHSSTCVQHNVVQQHLFLLQIIRKGCTVFQANLDVYKHAASVVTTTLQEINTWSDVFQQALSEKTIQNSSKRWTEIVLDSVTAEITQVDQHFSTLNKLNQCYQTHLEGLHQRALQSHNAQQSQRIPGKLMHRSPSVS